MRDPTTALTARQASATKLDALCRKARILRAATSGGYGDALAARLAAAGARAAQARRAGRLAVTPERLKEMMRIVQEQRRAAAAGAKGRKGLPHREAPTRRLREVLRALAHLEGHLYVPLTPL